MDIPTRLTTSIAVFSVFGLVAPIIQRALRPAASFLILVWPALVLTSGGTAATAKHDLAMAVVANVLIFAMLGFFIAIVCRRQWMFVAAYGLICALVVLGEAWGAGFNLAYFDGRDAVVAMALYLTPFAVLWFRNRSRT